MSIPPIDELKISIHEVKELLNSINIYKSGGPDNVHPKLLKGLSSNANFVKAIYMLFKKCIDTGQIPSIWKTAHVTALHKKGLKCDVENYRPISLTCILCKLFEKIIRKHIMNHFEPFASNVQHGFLNGKSCLSNLLECFDKVEEILANGDDVDLLYLDFQKAFDTVPHQRLLYKLKSYGISGNVLKVISDFLTGRTFQVRVGDSFSSIFEVISGVPQGSVLGPLLFLIYINDIPDGIKNFLLLFADDVKLIMNANTGSINQQDLDKLCKWQEKWLLIFNTIDHKCKVLPVARGSREVSNKYYLNGYLLPELWLILKRI